MKSLTKHRCRVVYYASTMMFSKRKFLQTTRILACFARFCTRENYQSYSISLAGHSHLPSATALILLVHGRGVCTWLQILVVSFKLLLLKNNGIYSTTFDILIPQNIHNCCFSWKGQLVFIDQTSTCPFNHTPFF